MKRTIVCVLVSLLCFATAAFIAPTNVAAWGSLTHALIGHELGQPSGLVNPQEIYGAALPDLFNLMFDSPYREYLAYQTQFEFDKMVDVSWGIFPDAAVFGCVTHNGRWGSDWTAHTSARTHPAEGYVYAKRALLAASLEPRLVVLLTEAGVPDPEGVAATIAPGLAENFVETAVDVLVYRNQDPWIGWRLALAAQLRDFRVPFVLSWAYARDFAAEFGLSYWQARSIIVEAENQFRDMMTLYGGIFTRSESEVIDLLAQQGAALARSLMKSLTGYDVTVSPQLLADILANEAIPLVEGDYGAELSATIAYLREEMEHRGYEPVSETVTAVGDGSDGFGRTPPVTVEQNRPNPFNGSTTIEYALSAEAQVRLAVYNARGQLIDVLVEGVQPPGHHAVAWEAPRLPSGVYFYRLESGPFTTTRKMWLLK
jgi:hypothetical protein